MNATGTEIYYGLCPDSTDACPHSYLKGRNLNDRLVTWFSGVSIPGGGGQFAARDYGIQSVCRTIIQTHPSPEGFCVACGRRLVFTNVPPALGTCQKCSRDYQESDMSQNFCFRCGEPIDISDALKEEMKRYRITQTIIDTIPQLKRHGYLPTAIRSDTK